MTRDVSAQQIVINCEGCRFLTNRATKQQVTTSDIQISAKEIVANISSQINLISVANIQVAQAPSQLFSRAFMNIKCCLWEKGETGLL